MVLRGSQRSRTALTAAWWNAGIARTVGLVRSLRMVFDGQYLERATVIPGPRGVLEGLFHRGRRRPGVLIAPPAPEDGGSMESAVVAELAWAVTRAGHPTLRFNYAGVGGSAGTRDPRTLDADVEAAERHLRASLEQPDGPLGACGFATGADLVLARAARTPASYEAVVAVTPTRPPPAGLQHFEGPLVVAVAQHGPHDVDGWRLRLEGAAGGRVVVIPRADAAFVRGLVELGRVVAEVFSPPGTLDLGP